MDTLTLINTLEKIYLSWGYAIIFLSSFIETTPLGWAIPGGAILALGGFYSYGKTSVLLITLTAGWFGQWLTFLIAYFIGLKSGPSLVKKLRQDSNAHRAKILLEKHGGVILTTSMLANLTRFWVAYVAGMQRYDLLRFIFYSGAASLTWTSLMVTVGYLTGSERGSLEKGLTSLGVVAWGLVIIAMGVIYWKTKKEFGEFKKEL